MENGMHNNFKLCTTNSDFFPLFPILSSILLYSFFCYCCFVSGFTLQFDLFITMCMSDLQRNDRQESEKGNSRENHRRNKITVRRFALIKINLDMHFSIFSFFHLLQKPNFQLISFEVG